MFYTAVYQFIIKERMMMIDIWRQTSEKLSASIQRHCSVIVTIATEIKAYKHCTSAGRQGPAPFMNPRQ